jgi:RNA polymerase sigma-70 factor (ECF subfamily)
VDATEGQRSTAVPEGAPTFAAFYDRAVREVFRYLYRATLGDRAVAEDLTQETFAAVVVAARAGKAQALELPWVIGIARHKLIDHHRRRERERRVLELASHDEELDESLDALTGSSSHVLDLLRALPEAQQLVLVLRYCDDLTVDQVARAIGLSVHATESRLARARRSLSRLHQESQR